MCSHSNLSCLGMCTHRRGHCQVSSPMHRLSQPYCSKHSCRVSFDPLHEIINQKLTFKSRTRTKGGRHSIGAAHRRGIKKVRSCLCVSSFLIFFFSPSSRGFSPAVAHRSLSLSVDASFGNTPFGAAPSLAPDLLKAKLLELYSRVTRITGTCGKQSADS